MNQSFDSFRQLDEGAIVGEAHYLAANPRADREPLLHTFPGVLRSLFVAQAAPPPAEVEEGAVLGYIFNLLGPSLPPMERLRGTILKGSPLLYPQLPPRQDD